MLALLLSLLFAVASCQTPTSSISKGVFYVGPVATAGAQTVVQFDLGASSCSSSLLEGGCDWPYARLTLMADPAYFTSHEGFTVWENFCTFSSSISTNLTSFEITIPRDAVPDGYPYSINYSFFRRNSNGSYSFFTPIWSVFDSPSFNITGSNTTWTDYDLSARFWSDNGGRPWFWNTTCEALNCARQCTEDIEAPLVPFVGGPMPKLDACVEACPGMGWDPTKIITENAAVVATSSSIGPTPTPTTTNDISSISSPTASPAATIKSLGIRTTYGGLLFTLATVNLFCSAWRAL